ncbi:hypothetical protein HB763_21005 [Vibrio campbellii]|nr:hypothetical protein HB763_21005 [Vibrio campbellii]
MSLMNKNLQITEADINNFQQDGFLLLKGSFSQEFISTVKNKIDNDISATSDKYQSGFSRISCELFVCSESKYDQKRALNREVPREHFKYKAPTRFHLDVYKEDGELIKSSILFKGDIETRTLTTN